MQYVGGMHRPLFLVLDFDRRKWKMDVLTSCFFFVPRVSCQTANRQATGIKQAGNRNTKSNIKANI